MNIMRHRLIIGLLEGYHVTVLIKGNASGRIKKINIIYLGHNMTQTIKYRKYEFTFPFQIRYSLHSAQVVY